MKRSNLSSRAVRVRSSWLVLALVWVLPAAESLAVPDDQHDGPRSEHPIFNDRHEAEEYFVNRLSRAKDRRARVQEIIDVALFERPEGVLGEIVEEYFQREALSMPSLLTLTFRRASPHARRRILELYDERWDVLGTGASGWRREMVRIGLESEHLDVRRAAARLMGRHPIWNIGHAAIDMTLEDPSLTVATLRALELTQDWRPVRWVIEQAASEDENVKRAALRALWALRREAAPHLIERLDAARQPERRAAIEGLLMVATPEDESVLYRWLEKYEQNEPELAARVKNALAQLEIGLYKPSPPDPPEQLFPD